MRGFTNQSLRGQFVWVGLGGGMLLLLCHSESDLWV